jgi:hypothetical protein
MDATVKEEMRAVSGGLTAPQRQVLQEYLVKDWK